MGVHSKPTAFKPSHVLHQLVDDNVGAFRDLDQDRLVVRPLLNQPGVWDEPLARELWSAETELALKAPFYTFQIKILYSYLQRVISFSLQFLCPASFEAFRYESCKDDQIVSPSNRL